MALQQNETVSITLKIEGDEARNKLALLEKEARDLEKALKEVPKGSKEWAELNKELNKNTVEQQKLRSEVGTTGLTYKQLQKEVKSLYKDLSTLTPGTQDFIDKSKRLSEVEARMGEVKKEMKGVADGLDAPNKQGLWGKMSSGFNLIKGAATAFMALQLVQVVLGWGKAIFDITAKFEKYEAVLTNALGSEKDAQESMKAIQQLAAKTTFSVDELTDGYVKMVNRGIRPTKAEMISMADLAASQGKSYDQYVEALLDAQTGEFERLKEFGIRATKSGDQVTLAFKGMQKTVANTPDAISGALNAFGEMEGVAGSNAKAMETLEGKSSNLGDNFDALQVEIGKKLRPVFVFLLDSLMVGIEVIRGLVNVVATAISYTKSYWTILYEFAVGAGGVLSNLGTAIKEFLSGNFDAARTAWDNTKKAATDVMVGVKDGVVKAGKEIKAIWSDPDAGKEAELAGKVQGQKFQGKLTDAQKKEAAKREKEKQKELDAYAAAEEKYDEQVRKDREKALELLAKLEAEHEQTVADNSLQAQEARINETRRKRLKEITDSLADEKTKRQAIEAINRNADAELEKARAEFRKKQQQAEDAAAQKRLEAANFIREQEQKAEMALFDWREQQAQGNARKLAAIRKERLDAELRFTKEKLAAELLAEQQKAIREIDDLEQLATALNTIEGRYHQESINAEQKAAAEKKAIDLDLHQKKIAQAKNYSDAFGALLRGDVTSFLDSASKMLSGHKTKLQEQMSADMQYYEMGAQVAQQAVAFLNDLAQRKAEKHIAEAARERDAKLGILQNELSVTESLITSSSNYVQALKTAETARLAELQKALTSETASEEEKRDALKKYYSDQFQQMKAAEEEKIKALQHEANMAKTEDEKKAIEAKIALAKEESETKIKLAEEELESKKKSIDELTDFTTETTQAVLAEATEASEKQVLMAEDEAQKKYDTKVDLEEAIAAENRNYREKEAYEKKKAWEAQKKADIATALITGALAILKALANFFPLNIILAATAGVVTAIQINKIKNQPQPTFADGGVVRGGRHGASYGDGGIALVDRASGREVGEMEGDEAIVSAEQTRANWPLIEAMFKNARNPAKRSKPVDLPAFRDGGMFEAPYFQRGMYLFGIKKAKKEAEKAAQEAEAEAKRAQAEAEAAMSSYGFDDAGAYGGIDQGGVGINGDTAAAQAAHEQAQKQGEMQLQLLQDIVDTLLEVGQAIVDSGTSTQASLANLNADIGAALGQLGTSVNASLMGVKDAVDGVRGAVSENVGATRAVEGAVNNANANGILGAIMERISALK
jgi:hypothetical protein